MGIVVEDLEKTRVFYLGFLGMTEVPRPSNFMFEGAWFETENQGQIHVILSKDTTSESGIPDPGVGKSGGLSTHFAFEVNDLDAFMERAKSMNINIVGGPYVRGLGATQIYLQDPDGYQVELFEMTHSNEEAQVRGALLD